MVDEKLKESFERIENLNKDDAILLTKKLEKEAIKNLGSKIGNMFDKRELAEHIIELQPCYYDKARN